MSGEPSGDVRPAVGEVALADRAVVDAKHGRRSATRPETKTVDMDRQAADLAVFDPNTVIDKATFEKPAQYSEGFRDVLVGGTFVVRDGKPQEGVAPGQGILAR